MPFIMPELIVQKVVQEGIKKLRVDRDAFNDIFDGFKEPEMDADYGQRYIDKIWEFFTTVDIPVIQSWNFNAQRIPCYSIHLATELEDESKAAAGDYLGDTTGLAETGVAVFSVMVDIGIHASKAGDHVLWLYYILSYILFKEKLLAERLGLQIHTFNASDYIKDKSKVMENVFTRWVRFRCTTENTWLRDSFITPDEIDLDIDAGRVGDEDDTEIVDID